MQKLNNETLKPYTYPFLLAFLQCFQLQLSSLKMESLAMIFHARIYVSIFILYCCILLIHRSKKLLYAEAAFITIFSVINYYVYLYHQGPLYFSTIKSAGTAFEVMKGYNFKIDIYVVLLILLVLPQILIIKKHDFSIPIKAIAVISLLTIIATAILLQDDPFISLPAYCIRNEGFPIAFTRDLKLNRKAIKPEQYEKYTNDRSKEGTETPDIVLVLDESYSTLDNESKLKDLDNAVIGKAVVSNVGGGTNNSEFELLTSNSMKLLYEDAPFNYLQESVLKNSTINHLKSLGYETTAMHCCQAQNYNRHIAYPWLGFDNIYIGESYYTRGFYGNRPWLDKDNFADLFKYCKFEGKPQFVYMLTYQNHGGYEQNDDSLDTVHKTGYGELTDDVNEYLSSIDLTEDAFMELIEPFRNSDRHTIVCMVGDHNPPFVEDIMNGEIEKRQVNYIIWANYDIDFEGGNTTMTDMLPIILNNANISTSDFLQTAYEVHRRYPIHTTVDILIDESGNESVYDGSQKILNEYYSKEYDRLTE